MYTITRTVWKPQTDRAPFLRTGIQLEAGDDGFREGEPPTWWDQDILPEAEAAFDDFMDDIGFSLDTLGDAISSLPYDGEDNFRLKAAWHVLARKFGNPRGHDGAVTA